MPRLPSAVYTRTTRSQADPFTSSTSAAPVVAPSSLASSSASRPTQSPTYLVLLKPLILSAPSQSMTLQEIYAHLEARPGFLASRRTQSNGWKNTIRNLLSLDPDFSKVGPPPGRGRGSAWTVTENASETFTRVERLQPARSKRGSSSSSSNKRKATHAHSTLAAPVSQDEASLPDRDDGRFNPTTNTISSSSVGKLEANQHVDGTIPSSMGSRSPLMPAPAQALAAAHPYPVKPYLEFRPLPHPVHSPLASPATLAKNVDLDRIGRVKPALGLLLHPSTTIGQVPTPVPAAAAAQATFQLLPSPPLHRAPAIPIWSLLLEHPSPPMGQHKALLWDTSASTGCIGDGGGGGGGDAGMSMPLSPTSPTTTTGYAYPGRDDGGSSESSALFEDGDLEMQTEREPTNRKRERRTSAAEWDATEALMRMIKG